MLKKVIIKSYTGHVPCKEAYNDELTIDFSGEITYHKMPILEYTDNNDVKWSYKTTSKMFREYFNPFIEVIEKVNPILNEIKDKSGYTITLVEDVVSEEIVYSGKMINNGQELLNDYLIDLFHDWEEIPGYLSITHK